MIARYSTAVKLSTFTATSFATLINRLSSFTAQNISARQIERAKKGLRARVRMALGVALPSFLLSSFLGDTMISMLMKEGDTAAMDTGATFLKVISPLYFVISLKLMADGVLRGAGDMVYFMIATFMDLIFRVILAYVLASFTETLGIRISRPIGWVVATVLSMELCLSGKWNLLKE